MFYALIINFNLTETRSFCFYLHSLELALMSPLQRNNKTSLYSFPTERRGDEG